ncbi:MAG: GNAT family N-acetyltransferase, partial [Clostridiales bacterium]|nr:GNAT family N-acetyltransferase [Clostridiales bacterium]
MRLNTEITLNRAYVNRAVEISRFLAKCWKSSYRDIINGDYLSSLKDDHWVAFLEAGIENNTITCITAEASGGIVGVTIAGNSITERYPDDGEVISLYVDPEFIGKRVGHSLFERAQQSLVDLGFSHCIVCAFSENVRAVHFYQKHGFYMVSDNETITMGTQELPYVIMR